MSESAREDPAGPGVVRTVMSAGFRAFFLFAGLFAVVSMTAWMAWLAIHAMNGMIAEPSIAVAPHLWHGHELIFGYSGAVLAGFLMTAVPNWTGRPAPDAAMIASLFALWLIGRVAVWLSALLPPAVVMMLDLPFLLALAAWMIAQLRNEPGLRNAIFPVIILGLAGANLIVHLAWMEVIDDGIGLGLRLAIALFALKITVIGGRVVPAFTRNALMRDGGADRLPKSRPVVDRLSILAAAVYALTVAVDAPQVAIGAAALAAGLVNGLRFSGWCWWKTLGSSIVWSLHLAYAALIAGFLAVAAANLTGLIDEIAAQHVIGIGAMGGMSLAIMSRAALGHSGRPLTAPATITAAYLLIVAAMVVRGFGLSLVPDHYYAVIFVSGGCWVAGFALFTAVYLPILARPRRR